jgi:hypothetical protein
MEEKDIILKKIRFQKFNIVLVDLVNKSKIVWKGRFPMSLKEILKFIQDGSYLKLKQEEEKLYHLKNIIRAEQDELNLKRIVWNELGIVGEFETYRQYNYNYTDINILLLDLGMLQLNTFVRSDELLEEEREKLKHIQIPEKYFLRFSASNDLREQILDKQYKPNLNNLRLIEKVALWRDSYIKFELLNNRWENERMSALESSDYKLTETIIIKNGTLSIVKSPVRYRSDKVIDTLGIETILNAARVEHDKLVEFTARGFLKKKELNNLRKVIDVKRRYLLMTLQKEDKKKEYWYTKLKNLSRLSQK